MSPVPFPWVFLRTSAKASLIFAISFSASCVLPKIFPRIDTFRFISSREFSFSTVRSIVGAILDKSLYFA